MKLVAAKCPNCGANINVDPNVETIKCKYCESAILIDDAIEKYKIEISGEIEVKNIPGLDNYLKLGERNYSTNNYEEAYKNYGKAIELDPNNKIALLRYAICKTLLNNYIDFSLDYLKKSFNEVVELSQKDNTYEEEIQKYVNEVCNAIVDSLYAVRSYYNSYTVNGSDVVQIQRKLISICDCYEIIYNHAKENQKQILKQLISVLKDILRDKSYKTGTSIEGGVFLQTYKSTDRSKTEFVNKLNHYENILNPNTENSSTKDVNKYKVSDFSKKKIKTSTVVVDILLGIMALAALSNGALLSFLIMAGIFTVITFEKVSNLIFKENEKARKWCIVILVILLIITINANV